MADDASFDVLWSAEAKSTLKAFHKKSPTARDGKSFAQVVEALDANLRRDPLNVGEAYRSRGVIEEHIAVQDFLSINFSIDTKRRLVLVRSCKGLSGHGLD